MNLKNTTLSERSQTHMATYHAKCAEWASPGRQEQKVAAWGGGKGDGSDHLMVPVSSDEKVLNVNNGDSCTTL